MLKYQRFTLSGCRDIGIRKFEFVAKTQFLYAILLLRFCELVPSQILILRTSLRKANLSGYIIHIRILEYILEIQNILHFYISSIRGDSIKI